MLYQRGKEETATATKASKFKHSQPRNRLANKLVVEESESPSPQLLLGGKMAAYTSPAILMETRDSMRNPNHLGNPSSKASCCGKVPKSLGFHGNKYMQMFNKPTSSLMIKQLIGAFLGAAAFFGVGLGGGAFFPGDVLVDVLEAFAGLSFGLGRAETFGLAAALGFAAAGLAFTGAFAFVAAFGFAAALGFGLATALGFGLAGALVAALIVFVSLALDAGLALGLAAAGFFFAGAELTDGFGADDLAGGSLKELLTLTSFPAATSFLDWVKRSFLKLDGSCLCFSSINLAIANRAYDIAPPHKEDELEDSGIWEQQLFSTSVPSLSLSFHQSLSSLSPQLAQQQLVQAPAPLLQWALPST
ncbi:uncharacterized protein G2W53_043784 [Senna tora]|uniref:Uncharacterized protein n=1 Tax=Senna tora TaxID=362788 RepID=A0A834SLB4_9FABA|nr:uncharacterized protein G2W53_043784 [Senna tora]